MCEDLVSFLSLLHGLCVFLSVSTLTMYLFLSTSVSSGVSLLHTHTHTPGKTETKAKAEKQGMKPTWGQPQGRGAALVVPVLGE